MDMNYKIKTNKSFEDAIESLKISLEENKFGVLWELNFKDKLREKGLEFDKNFQVLEVCNPKQAKKVLDEHIEVGYFLPCKIVIYEDKGSVYIGMTKPTSIIGMLGNDKLLSTATEVENTLINAINLAK